MEANGTNWTQGVEFTRTVSGLSEGDHQFFFTASVDSKTLRFPFGEATLSLSTGELILTANPTSIQFTGSSSSIISAIVRDPSGVPLNGVEVDFTRLRYGTALMLVTAYTASLGGMATPVVLSGSKG